MRNTVLLTVALFFANTLHAETSVPDQSLESILKRAEDALQYMEKDIRDYTCVLTKRERVRGRLQGPESLYLKVRHHRIDPQGEESPFSVYLRFYKPAAIKEREVIYVEGLNEGKMIVRNGGERFAYITTAVLPDAKAALQESRYPITEVGMKTLTRRLIEVGRTLLDEEQCETKIVPGAKINGRDCTMLQVKNSIHEEGQEFQFVRIIIDEELELPVHYAAYDWPEKEGGEPVLLEEYTYTNIRLNVGLTDLDFDHRNEDYLFLKSFTP